MSYVEYPIGLLVIKQNHVENLLYEVTGMNNKSGQGAGPGKLKNDVLAGTWLNLQ